MKIALINENSQAAKNEIIYNSLKNTVEPIFEVLIICNSTFASFEALS